MSLLPELLAAVEQQLTSRQTPYVAKTLQRLVALGIAEDEAKQQIAICLAETIEEMTKKHRGFDEKAYRTALDELPMEEDEEDPEELAAEAGES